MLTPETHIKLTNVASTYKAVILATQHPHACFAPGSTELHAGLRGCARASPQEAAVPPQGMGLWAQGAASAGSPPGRLVSM